MPLSTDQFWHRVADREFLSPAEVERLRVDFQRQAGDREGNVSVLSAWLVKRSALSPRQVREILADEQRPAGPGLERPSVPAEHIYRNETRVLDQIVRLTEPPRGWSTATQVGLGLLGFVATIVVAGLAYMVLSNRDKPPLSAVPREVADSPPAERAPTAGQNVPRRTESGVDLVPDDGLTLWASPTSGAPIDLAFLPAGTQAVLSVRARSLVSTPEGAQALVALGPQFDQWLQRWQERAGCGLREIEQLTVGLAPRFPDPPQVVAVVRLAESPEFPAMWAGAEKVSEVPRIYRAGDRCYLIPRHELRTFVMGETSDLVEISRTAGAPPPLRREMEQLQAVTDSQRHLNLLFVPSFLLDSRWTFFSGPHRLLLESLGDLFGDGVQAALLSAHAGQCAYVELRCGGSVDLSPRMMAMRLEDTLLEMPAQVSAQLGSAPLAPYWQRLAVRLPLMTSFVVDHSRVDIVGQQAVANAAMPGAALHNLVLAGELLLLASSQAAGDEAGADATGSPVVTGSDVLSHRTTLSIAQQSFEFAIRDLWLQVQSELPGLPSEFRVEILGVDLRQEGITRNQPIRDFQARDKTVAELLTALVVKANPVPAAAPDDPEQKLVWLIGPDPDRPDQQIILISTRRAAGERGWDLPQVFRGP
jgi:hypothetical protein